MKITDKYNIIHTSFDKRYYNNIDSYRIIMRHSKGMFYIDNGICESKESTL